MEVSVISNFRHHHIAHYEDHFCIQYWWSFTSRLFGYVVVSWLSCSASQRFGLHIITKFKYGIAFCPLFLSACPFFTWFVICDLFRRNFTSEDVCSRRGEVCKGWKTVKVAWLDSINAMEECDEYYREVVIASIIVTIFTVIISVPVIINLIVILIHRCIVNHILSFSLHCMRYHWGPCIG